MIVKVAVPEKFKLKVVPDFRTLIFGGQKEIHYIGGTDVLPPVSYTHLTLPTN